MAVPESIQSVILSRVDRLEAETRHVLQSAAVIGRLFRRRLVARWPNARRCWTAPWPSWRIAS